MILVQRHAGRLLVGIHLAIQVFLSHAQRFSCETASCAKYDVWTNVSFENSTEVCDQLQLKAFDDFIPEFRRQCREWAAAGLGPWGDCRRMYCQTLGQLAGNLSHMGTNMYYGGDECRPLLNFNQTLCETSYRDTEAFCDCLCPTMGKLQIPAVGGCEDKILQFLLLGRRGYELSQKYQLSGYCAGFICEHSTKLGDPDPAFPVDGIPPVCLNFDLPWRLYNCNELLSRKPYDPEPWDTPYPQDSVLECTDTTTHPVDLNAIDTWGVCSNHKFRWRCPQDFPVMCRDPYYCLGQGPQPFWGSSCSRCFAMWWRCQWDFSWNEQDNQVCSMPSMRYLSVDFHSAWALQVITAACKLWQSAQEVNVLHQQC